MPFTVSHAAAILPLRKLNLICSAFIVGSMAPDFSYIIGNTNYRNLGHHFPGLIEFTLPISVAALWLFHATIKRPIVGLLPIGIQARLRGYTTEFRFFPASRFLRILGSISLGIASHLIWDSFTHAYTWPWRNFSWLRARTYIPVLHRRLPMFSALQYASTFIGLLALAIWIFLWYRNSPVILGSQRKSLPKSRFGLAIGMFAIAAIAGIVRAIILIGLPPTVARADTFILICGVTSLAVAFWQLFLYCVLMSSYQMWTLN
jgi:hypothetical protein